MIRVVWSARSQGIVLGKGALDDVGEIVVYEMGEIIFFTRGPVLKGNRHEFGSRQSVNHV